MLFVNVNDVLFWWGGLQTTLLTIPVWMDCGHFGQQHLNNIVDCALFDFVHPTHPITSSTLSFATCRNTWTGLVCDCWRCQSWTAEGQQEPGLGPFDLLQVQSFAVQHLRNQWHSGGLQTEKTDLQTSNSILVACNVEVVRPINI